MVGWHEAGGGSGGGAVVVVVMVLCVVWMGGWGYSGVGWGRGGVVRGGSEVVVVVVVCACPRVLGRDNTDHLAQQLRLYRSLFPSSP